MSQHQSSSSSIPGESVRTLVSLLIVIHLFCVFVVLSSNFMPSGLQQDLVAIVSPYTKTLHLDPNFVPFHLVAEDGDGRLHQWQIIVDNEILHRFPDSQLRGGFNRRRQDVFARVGGYYAMNELDDVPAEMAKSLAEHVIAISSTEVERLHIRCVRYIGDADPVTSSKDSEGVNALYDADVWRTESGKLNLLKRTEPYRTSPSVTVDGN